MAQLSPNPAPGDFSIDFRGEWKAALARSDAALKALTDVSDALPDGEVVGGVIRFPIADGYALYRVAKEKPLILEHIPYMDGYAVDAATIRGLRRTDIEAMLRRWRGLRSIFSKR